MAVSLLKPPPETAARPFQKQKRNGPQDPEVVKNIRWGFYKALYIIFFQGGDDGRG
jgi:hypothetical protein